MVQVRRSVMVADSGVGLGHCPWPLSPHAELDQVPLETTKFSRESTMLTINWGQPVPGFSHGQKVMIRVESAPSRVEGVPVWGGLEGWGGEQ